MNKQYYIEAKFGPRWVLLKTETRHKEALDFAKEHSGEKYPLRIIRVIRTVVFEDKK